MLLKDIVLAALLSFAVRLGTAQEVSLCKGDGTFLETSNIPGANSTCKCYLTHQRRFYLFLFGMVMVDARW